MIFTEATEPWECEPYPPTPVKWNARGQPILWSRDDCDDEPEVCGPGGEWGE